MDYDVAVIGSGPGGYTAACLAAKNGLKTAVIENSKLGGVCLNEGCIPTKALIHLSEKIGTVVKGKITGLNEINPGNINKDDVNNEVAQVAATMSKGIDFLFKSNKVDVLKGYARILDKNKLQIMDENNNIQEISVDNIIIASGSRNRDFNDVMKNRVSGSKIIDSTQALFLEKIPGSICVIGGGAIGVEFSYIYNLLGSQVSLLEYFPNLLPNTDIDCGKTLERSFKKQKIKVTAKAKVVDIRENSNGCEVVFERNGEESVIAAEYVLLAMGRVPNTDDIGLDKLDKDILDKGYIRVNPATMQTDIDNIYAIGDVVAGSPLLAHVAYDEARVAVENILKKDTGFAIDNSLIPFCIYSYPQVANFGMDDAAANEAGVDFEALKVHFKASGKAVALGKSEGFIKILIDKKTENIIGASIIGPDATELLHELILAAKTKLSLKEIADTMHAHPTLSEMMWEAAKSYYGLALH